MISEKAEDDFNTRSADSGRRIAPDESGNDPEWIVDLRDHYGCGDSLPDPDVLEPGAYADYVEQIDEVGVRWRRTEAGKYQAGIGTWSFTVGPPTGVSREWTVLAVHRSGHLRDFWYAPSLAEAERRAKGHAKILYDFRGFEHYSTGLLAQVLHNVGLLGIEWDEGRPEPSDERYHRCLLAAGAALDTYWDEDTPLCPGEPLGPPASPIPDIFGRVHAFVFDKINHYFTALGEGISTPEYRRQVRRSRAAARRATASLFGVAAMWEADRQFDRAEAASSRPRQQAGPNGARLDRAERWMSCAIGLQASCCRFPIHGPSPGRMSSR